MTSTSGARGTTLIRPLRVDDAAELRALLLANEEFLRPWMPRREPAWYSLEQRRLDAMRDVDSHRRGAGLHFVVTTGGRIIGRVDLTNVVRAAWQNATIGYWIAQADCGKGHASAAVRQAV